MGIDIAKGVHWATAIDDLGRVVVDQRVANEPAGLQGLIDALAGLGDEPVIGVDVVGGIAGLAEALLGRPGSGWSMCRGWPSTEPTGPTCVGVGSRRGSLGGRSSRRPGLAATAGGWSGRCPG